MPQPLMPRMLNLIESMKTYKIFCKKKKKKKIFSNYHFFIIGACMYEKLLQLCLPLCGPMEHSLPGSSVHGILQARRVEWVATPYSRGSSQTGDQTSVFCNSCTAGGFFTTEPPGKPYSQGIGKQK